jgi:hypothetical protein
MTPAGDPIGVPDGDYGFVNYYFKNGYAVAQLAWDSPWQTLWNPWPISTFPLGNIQVASCRPATALNWIFRNIYLPIQGVKPNAGFYAQGSSAGAAAIAYSMTYYKPKSGTQWWMDNLELLSGPVLSDIKQGCKVPNVANIDVCGNGESWCHYSSPLNWNRSLTYDPPYVYGVQAWTDDTSCNNGSTTSSSSNNQWLHESLVDDGTNSPVYSYPHTMVSAWLCRGLSSGLPNNSSSQGYLWYKQVGGAQPLQTNVWAVDSCPGAEGVAGGIVSTSGDPANTTILQDMAGVYPTQAGKCVHQ